MTFSNIRLARIVIRLDIAKTFFLKVTRSQYFNHRFFLCMTFNKLETLQVHASRFMCLIDSITVALQCKLMQLFS